MRCFMASLLLLALALPVPSALVAEPPGAGPVNLAEVLRTLAREHEARERLQPALLLEGALAAASEAIPPLLYERSGGDMTLDVTVGTRTHRFDPPAPGDLARLATQLEALRAFLAQSLPPAERPPELDTILAAGLLRAADAHSGLLSATAYEDFQSQASGRAGGLGMLLARGPEGLTVESVLPDSPAERAGLRGGDRLLQIGERTVLHLPVDEALGLIRGRVGTPVALLILRDAEPGPRQLTLRRSSLRFASVTSRLFDEGGRSRVGYLHVRSFQESTTAELSEHLQRMAPGRPGLAGIVLDLRDNPGGVLEQAIRVADLFLERGTIVTMRGARGQREVVPARWYHSISSAPLVVLVNEGTASAGEVVAGALKFNHRALLVGAQTFGKDSIQSVFPLSGGSALKLTVARFLPANGQAMEGAGIVPHIWLRPVREGPAPARFDGLRFTATGAASEAMRRVGKRNPHPVRELPYLVPVADAERNGADDGAHDPPPDYALTMARRLLLANAPQGQSALLRHALDWVQTERRAQDQAIAQRLAVAAVDWSHGGGDDGGQVELLRVEAQARPAAGGAWAPLPPGAPIAPGSRLRLALTVRNAGALPLHRVLCVVESDADWLRRREVPIGRLAAGLGAEATLEADVPPEVPQGLEPLRLRIYDGQRRLHYRATVLLALGPARLPRLQVTLRALDDGSAGSRGNGDGRAQPGEVLALRVGLRNLGQADTGPGRFWLSGGLPGQTRLVRPWQAIEPIPAGGLREAVLLLELGRPQVGAARIDGPEREGPQPGSGGLRLNLMNGSAALPELSWPLALSRAQPLPRLRLAAPVLELHIPDGAVEGSRVVLRGAVRDDRGLHDLVVFRNGRKLLYQRLPDEDTTELPLRLVLPLEPGRNLLRVEVRDRDGLISNRAFTLWQGRGQGFPLTSPPGGGA